MRYAAGTLVNIMVAIRSIYSFMRPEAWAAVHNGPDMASIIANAIMSCVNCTEYSGTTESHIFNIGPQQIIIGKPIMNISRNENARP